MSTGTNNNFSDDYSSYAEYLENRGRLRTWIRSFYLRNILKHVKGATLDFGCGAGNLLSLLPAGSLGLERNEKSVELCQRKGLNVFLFDPEKDAYQFIGYEKASIKTFIAIHVLEHIVDAATVIKKITAFSERAGIEKIVFVVPGLKGFFTDNTHKTYIDLSYITKNGLTSVGKFHLIQSYYYPFPFEWVQKYFTHNELLLIFERKTTS